MAKQINLEPAEPTPEQRARSVFVEDVVVDRKPGRNMVIGRAHQRVPIIDILASQSVFTQAEYHALSVYRHYASIADRSPLRDSLNRDPGKGYREGMTLAVITAHVIASNCERAAGNLADILRAIVVDDLSLSEWVIQKGGGIEVTRQRGGKPKSVIEARERPLHIARIEIRIAAQRVDAELAA